MLTVEIEKPELGREFFRAFGTVKRGFGRKE